jgi:hypothetical protein
MARTTDGSSAALYTREENFPRQVAHLRGCQRNGNKVIDRAPVAFDNQIEGAGT